MWIYVGGLDLRPSNRSLSIIDTPGEMSRAGTSGEWAHEAKLANDFQGLGSTPFQAPVALHSDFLLIQGPGRLQPYATPIPQRH